MPNRVKEAIFDILGSRLGTPGELPPTGVADLFAGSGSMGLEALSRGASFCYFFERHPRALEALRANIRRLAPESEAIVLPVDAWKDPFACVRPGHNLGLLILDPPYHDSRDSSSGGAVCRLLADSTKTGRIADAALAVVHHEPRVPFDADVADWHQVDTRRYGTNAITFFRHARTR